MVHEPRSVEGHLEETQPGTVAIERCDGELVPEKRECLRCREKQLVVVDQGVLSDVWPAAGGRGVMASNSSSATAQRISATARKSQVAVAIALTVCE